MTEFVVFRLGEGVEKVESDFAAEVAAAAGTGKSLTAGKRARHVRIVYREEP